METRSTHIKLLVLISVITVGMAGCASVDKDEIFPKDMPTMKEIYRNHMKSGGYGDDSLRPSNTNREQRIINEILKESIHAFEQKRWRDVIQLSNLIIDMDPYHSKALTNRSVALAEIGFVDKAIEDSEAATYSDPNNVVAVNNKAYVYEKAGMLEKAKVTYAQGCEQGNKESCSGMTKMMKEGYRGDRYAAMLAKSRGLNGQAKPTKVSLNVKQEDEEIYRAVYREEKKNIYEGYVRTADNELDTLFKELPNPDLIMYVHPHLAGTEEMGVPGYVTKFKMYEKTFYALPGEVRVD